MADVTEPTTVEEPSHGAAEPPEDRWRPDRRTLVPVAVIFAIVVIAGVSIALFTGHSTQPLPNNVTSKKVASFDGAEASPPEPAPPLALNNYLGQPVNIANYHGKVVLVTFLYANCPTLCPLIAANLHTAQAEMGPLAKRVQIIAVSVDPRGDTPQAVAGFLSRHGMVGKMQYLIGNAQSLGRVWAAWNVGSERDAQEPDLINHSGLVYGIAASGKLTTLYPGNFTPSMIVHDIPGLLAS